MAAAVVVVDAALREDFGFRHVTWVYSGRRGVHCWVADEAARSLADDARAACVSYLSLYRGSEAGKAKLAGLGGGGGPGGGRHPSVERARAVLLEAWRAHVLPAQAPLDDPSGEAALQLLRYVPDEELTEGLRREWAESGGSRGGGGGGNGQQSSSSSLPLSVRRWDELSAAVEAKAASLRRAGNRAKAAQLSRGLLEAMFAGAYPRLDVEVTKKMNHLLKAPFCVHPKTGRVCVPFEASRAFDFDPEAAPALGDLLDELKAADASGSAAREDAWRSTSMAAHVEAWERGFLAPLQREAKAALAAKAARDAQEQRRSDVGW